MGLFSIITRSLWYYIVIIKNIKWNNKTNNKQGIFFGFVILKNVLPMSNTKKTVWIIARLQNLRKNSTEYVSTS